jgi:hypothetical protein
MFVCEVTPDTTHSRVLLFAVPNGAEDSSFLMDLFPMSLELFLNPECLVTVGALERFVMVLYVYTIL